MTKLLNRYTKISAEDAELLGLFCGVQYHGERPTNLERHVEIINMLSHFPRLNKPKLSDRLCELHKTRRELKENKAAEVGRISPPARRCGGVRNMKRGSGTEG